MTTTRRQPQDRQRPKSAKHVQRDRPINEIDFTLRIAPPDGPSNAEGDPIPVDLHVTLRKFTLAERQLAARALAKMVQPPTVEFIYLVHGWIVWRRTNPTSSLQVWMDSITFGDLMDGLEGHDPENVVWDTTPEGYDPEA